MPLGVRTGDGDAFVREKREAMDVVLQALDGEHMSRISTRKPAKLVATRQNRIDIF